MITMPLGALMIATSDWMVLLLLGPQWRETGRIFMLLGIAAMIQPVTKTAWWLFSTQGRTRELFHWGLMGGAIAIVSIVAGLPWGATGVAASYAVADLCIATPLLFWYVGRRGPVRTIDFYRTIAPVVGCFGLFAGNTFSLPAMVEQFAESYRTLNHRLRNYRRGFAAGFVGIAGRKVGDAKPYGNSPAALETQSQSCR